MIGRPSRAVRSDPILSGWISSRTGRQRASLRLAGRGRRPLLWCRRARRHCAAVRRPMLKKQHPGRVFQRGRPGPQPLFNATWSAEGAVRAGMSDEWDVETDGGRDRRCHKDLAARSPSGPTRDPPSAPGGKLQVPAAGRVPESRRDRSTGARGFEGDSSEPEVAGLRIGTTPGPRERRTTTGSRSTRLRGRIRPGPEAIREIRRQARGLPPRHAARLALETRSPSRLGSWSRKWILIRQDANRPADEMQGTPAAPACPSNGASTGRRPWLIEDCASCDSRGAAGRPAMAPTYRDRRSGSAADPR